MRLRDLHNDDGTHTGFEMDNGLLGRRRACRIAESVPGVQIVRRPKLFPWRDSDDFCEFELEGVRFLIIEPFGDNDCYWVVAKEPGNVNELARVRAVFAGARSWGL